jgi:uncharacterized membrane protein YphA (DoxX/SURF4 family)
MNHSLRLSLLLLRLAIGLSFFYLGWTILFNRSLAFSLGSRSLPGLSSWLASSPSPIAAIPASVFAWTLLVVGILIIIGLFTRLASLIGIVIVLASLLPAINFTAFNPVQLVNDEVIVLFALLVLIFGKAGHYLGVDGGLQRRRAKRKSKE